MMGSEKDFDETLQICKVIKHIQGIYFSMVRVGMKINNVAVFRNKFEHNSDENFRFS